MGERVVFDPATAARSGERPTPAVPLDYGHADDPAAGAWRATAGVREQGDSVAQQLGGWRRVGFAFGVGFALGAVVYGFTDFRQCETAGMLAGLGGLLIGFTVPVKGLDATPSPREALGPAAR